MIGPNYFARCETLEEIFLSYNKLTSIPDVKFVSYSLVLVEIGANMIEDVTHLYGLYFPKLMLLDLSGNHITKFCLPSFHYTPIMKTLLLSENDITSIPLPYERGRYLRGLVVVLAHNPWHCDSWFSHCFDKSHTNIRFVTCPNHITFRDVYCQSPSQMTRHLAWDVGELYSETCL